MKNIINFDTGTLEFFSAQMKLTRSNVGCEVGIVLVNTISDGFKILIL